MPAKTVKVRDLMTRKVMTLDRNDTLDMAEDVMEFGRIRHIPILEAGQVIGVVSQRDLFRSALAFALGYGEHGSRKLLHTFHVKDVMKEPAVTIASEATLDEAAKLMLQEKVGCLPVVDEGKMVGILSESDVLRHVAES